MNVGTIIAISAISALASMSPTDQTVELEAKRYTLARAPEQAASCVARNAAATAGQESYVQELYGTERIAVVVREAPIGDTRASVYLEPSGAGSSGKIVTTAYVDDREALIKQLLAGC